MAKVHPNSMSVESPVVRDEDEQVMTVWRKSLLFNCKGFTVYDSTGSLVFRVDNYPTSSKREIVLMDGRGLPLFTITRKRLSIGERWLIYEGETKAAPLYAAEKHLTIRHSKRMVHLTPCSSWNAPQGLQGYVAEGSYLHRCCTVYDERRQVVAEVRRKEAAPGVSLGVDVFRLVVQYGSQAPLAMAIVVLLDQMFG